MGQSHCPVRVDFEPRESTQNRSANNIEEIKFPFFQQWEDLNKIRISDNERALVSLSGNKRSTLFKGNNLGFALPNGAKINGIELIVEGHSEGAGYVRGQLIKLLNANGEVIGDNQADNALPIDMDWRRDTSSTDFKWRYGSPTDTWGVALADDLVNNKNFGYALQIRNKLAESVSVFVDHIEMIVYYTPLYEVCSTHACVPFYVDKSEDPLISYEWYLPQGFELISTSEEEAAINIGVSYAEFGEYEICVESFYKQSSQGTCCRKFNYTNCQPSIISGQVFFDANNNSINDNPDPGIEDILINLYSIQTGFLSSTFTNDHGEYTFANLLPGEYHIEVVEEIDSLIFTTPNIGNDNQDSDITGAFGIGTTDPINLQSGDTISNIDAGLNLALSIGDFVWEDLNGDGIQQEDEPGIEGIEVKITSTNSIQYTTTTDDQGYYNFSGIPAGNYTIDFLAHDSYISTIPNNSDDHTDSDVISNSALMLSFSEGGTIDSIDAGYYLPSSVGDFVWEDLNGNGLQDESEPGISGVILELVDSDGISIQTTTSDSSGFYSFDNIPPGEYYIKLQTEIRFSPTEPEIGEDTGRDSDVFIQDEKLVSSSFTLVSNTENLTLDFGFIEKPAVLGGFTFLDQNNNGKYDPDESFVSGVEVVLFNSGNEQVDITKSDNGGFYSFSEIPASSYYLVFELQDDFLFTLPDVGDDLSDSDVTNSIANGSSDLFQLMPDEENYSFSAGYQKKPKVGDFVWLDENRNGIQDLGESGLNEVLIELYNDQNDFLDSLRTGPNPESFAPGYYQFRSLDPGKYYIKIPEEELYDFTIVNEDAAGFNSTITNANGIGTSNTFTLEGNQCNDDIDAGYAFRMGNVKGEVWIDQNEDGIQDPDDELKSGVLVELYDDNGERLFFMNTDEDGEYFFNGLDEGKYFVVFTPSNQYRFTDAYQGMDTLLDSDVIGENTAGSTAFFDVMDGITLEGIDAGLIDGSVNIDGMTWLDANGDGIMQASESPIPGINVDLYNLNDSLLATMVTDAEGKYNFRDNLAGQYYIVFTPENASYINTAANQGMDDDIDDDVTSFFTIGSTDTITITFFEDENFINAGYYELSSIGDQVFIDANENDINDNEPGLDNVVVNLIGESGTIIVSDTTSQGGGLDSGYYLLENITPGTYTVQFIRPLFYQFVAADQGGDDSIDSDVTEITNNTGTTKQIEILSGTTDLSIDAGLFYQVPMESSIAGIIWDDINNNGIRDTDESPISTVVLNLRNQDGELIDMTVSDSEGMYTFEELTEGFYTIQASNLQGKIATFANVGVDRTIDSDFIELGDEFVTESFFLATFEDLEHIDLGLVNTLTIGDFVWEDANNNGAQDANEIGIEEIEITITSENGIISKSTMSDAAGSYQFSDLPAGKYTLCADLPSGFHFAKSNIGADLLDSDVDSSGCTSLLDYSAGGVINDLDIGLTKNGSIEGIAFIDLNGNGVINLTDPGLDDVIVKLHNAAGDLLDSKMTATVDDIPGVFEFTNLKATDYYLVFEYPEEYIFTTPNVGDDMTDSDITGLFEEGSTDLFAVPSGGINNSIAGGAYLPASIGDEVWLDENQDGIRDEEEVGVEGIQVIIFRSSGLPLDTTETDSEGQYQFEGLKQGLYFIQFVIPQEYAISPADEGMDDNVDSDTDDSGKTPLISLAHGADLESIDCGIFTSTPSLRSVVWNDSNADGIRQDHEARIPGISISLADNMDNIIVTTESNSLGLYAFQEIPEGEYKIMVNLGDTDYDITEMNMDENDYLDCDINASGESEMFVSTVSPSTLSVPNVDVGLYETGGIISSIWEDHNADGVYDLDELGLSNIEASLYTKDAVLYHKTTSTTGYENLYFDNIPPGEYFIMYKVIADYVSSPIIGEPFDDNNSDISQFEGLYISPTFQIKGSEIITHIDAGFYKGASVVTDVWLDSNANGIQDENGNIPSGIYATLYDNNAQSISTRGINEKGEIHFAGIPKGKYFIKYYSSDALRFTIRSNDSEVNSDVDHSNGYGTTGYFTFDPYKSYSHIDAGLKTKNEVAYDLASLKNNPDKNETRDKKSSKMDEVYFEVHPNPAANYLKINVDRDQSGGIISIYNNQNQMVFTGNADALDRVDLSEYHPGIYYVKYELKGRSETKKILKIQ